MNIGIRNDILFVGLGAMGAPMSTLLAQAGHRVAVHDVDPERTEALAACIGATAVAGDGLSATAAQADTLILMLRTARCRGGAAGIRRPAGSHDAR